jgi:hypothetical protein
MSTYLDLNRGVITRKHKKAGMYVHMYRDEPGTYLTDHGKPLPTSIAEAAGFDVAKLQREKLKRERLKKFETEVTAELLLAEEQAEKDRDVIAERQGFRVIALPGGRAIVVDEENERLTISTLTREEALALLDELAPIEGGDPIEGEEKVPVKSK